MASGKEDPARNPSGVASEDDEALQWQQAMARARHRTYEGAEPASTEHAVSAQHTSATVPDSVGHAWRGPQVALPPPAAPAVRRWPAVLLTAAGVAALAGGGLMLLKQDYDRLLQAKDRQLARVEEQKSTAQEQREKAVAELAAERAALTAQVQDMRAQRNAAMIAAGLPPPADEPKVNAAAKPAGPLPKIAPKIDVSDDPLSGLRDTPSDTKKPTKPRRK